LRTKLFPYNDLLIAPRFPAVIVFDENENTFLLYLGLGTLNLVSCTGGGGGFFPPPSFNTIMTK